MCSMVRTGLAFSIQLSKFIITYIGIRSIHLLQFQLTHHVKIQDRLTMEPLVFGATVFL